MKQINKIIPRVGLKFKTFFNEKNINNRSYNEIRWIIDDTIIVLLSQNKNWELYYNMIDIELFTMYAEKWYYILLSEK